MKTKWIFEIMAGIMILSIFSISQAADRFYYGAYGSHDTTKDFSYMKDSLGFNISYGGLDSSNIHHWKDNELRAIVYAGLKIGSPSMWAYESYYTMWETEPLVGSYYNLSYDGGTLVNDPSASGGKAMKFTGPGTPGLIQWGPSYYQEHKYRLSEDTISYTAEFRLKFHYSLFTPLGPMGPGPPTPVCSIMVVDTNNDTILKANTLHKDDFPSGGHGGYKTFPLEDYTVSSGNRIEFQIYWFASPEAENFYVDYVKVYDINGKELIIDTLYNQKIIDYVSQDWTKTVDSLGDTTIYRWYLRDEPLSIDLFATNRHVDSLLKQVSPERVGFQAFNRYWNDSLEHEYFLRQDPTEYNVDIYPSGWWGPDSSGGYFQQGVSKLTGYLNESKQEAENREKDFWVTTQAFGYGWELLADSGDVCCLGCSLYYTYCDTFDSSTDSCYGPWWCCGGWKRPITSYEVRLQTFLALCYGADAVLYWHYYSRPGWSETLQRHEIILGLYDHLADTPTPRWWEIKNFTGPRIEKLGPIFNQLDWQGACLDDSLSSLMSYIDSIKSNDEPHWVEVGFFTADTGQYTDYFMLVNRECLESEAADYDVFFTDQRGLYRIRDMYTDSIIAVVNGSGDQFMLHLDAGEGKLFRVEPRLFSSDVIQVPQDSS